MLARSNNNLFSNRRDSGLSLIELMVSILLGVILSSGIIAVYLESKRNYAAEEELARIQENGRFALDLLKRELSMAGFYGGYFLADDLPPTSVGTDCETDWALSILQPIEIFNGNTATDLETNAGTDLGSVCIDSGEWKSGTDVFTIKRTAAKATVYEGLYFDGAQVDPNEWYLRVEGYGETKEWKAESSYALDPNTLELWEMYAKIFYIKQEDSDDIPTLCVKSLGPSGMTREQCLVEGIEDMQIEFGVDTNANPDSVPNTYTPDPNDMGSVVTARVYLLVRSLGKLVGTENATPKTYQLGLDPDVSPVTKSDGYLRQIFSTTVLVRNAILPAT